MSQVTDYKNILDASLPSLPGGLFSDVRRQQALEALIELGLPSRRDEDWKYSDPSLLNAKNFRPATAASDIEIPAAITDWPRLVIVNGQLIGEAPALPTGVTLLNLQDALDGPDWAHALLDVPSPDAMAHHNLAFAQGGMALHVDEGVDAGALEVVFLGSGQAEDAAIIRNLVVLAKDAKLKLVVRSLCDGPLGWFNQDTQIIVGANATLDHYVLMDPAAKGFLSAKDHIRLEGGIYHQHNLLMAAKSARYLSHLDVLSPRSEATFNGGFMAVDGETLDRLTRVHHHVPNAHTEQNFRGVLAAGGKAAFQGKVIVAKDAQQTVANQACNNLILDRSAEANVKPELLIFADDVKCAHGATVGELDEKALFYMTQRGVDPASAHAMLVAAFLGEILEAVDVDSLRDYMAGQVDRFMSAALKKDAA